MSVNSTSQSLSHVHANDSLESKPAIPEFASDCDPGDETDRSNLPTEVHARSGTHTGFRAAPLPSGF